MTKRSTSPDELEEIDDPSELLSKPLEPAPLVPPPEISGSSTFADPSQQKKRYLPPGFDASSSNSSASGGSRPAVWNPTRSQTTASSSAPGGSASNGNGMIIGGSGARVPTQFLDQNGGFTRPPPSQMAGSASTAPSMPGAFPSSSASAISSFSRPLNTSAPTHARPMIDLTLDSDDEDEDVKSVSHQSNGKANAQLGNASLPAASSVPVMPHGSGGNPGPTASSSSNAVVSIVDDDDDDEPVIVSHKRPEPEEFEIDHVKSNAIVCAGMINAVVLCMHGLPPALTFAGSIGQEPPLDPNFTRDGWPSASHFWTDAGYRPVMLHLSNPMNLPPASRALPGGWSYAALPPQRPDINVSVLVPPRAKYPHLPHEEADRHPPFIEPTFGSLAEKYVTSMEPLLRSNKIRCEARCRMVPIGRAQNFLHYLEILVFARRPDLPLISDRLSAYGIQLEHPLSYHPKDYPTEPQYTNPHNPPAGGMRNDHMMGMYNGIYRGANIGTSVHNRELTEKEKKAQVDAIYSSIRSGEELAAVEPVELISTKLLQHQKQALGFLLSREKDRRWTELLVGPSEKKEEAGGDSSADKDVKSRPGKVEPTQGTRNGADSSKSQKGKEKVLEDAVEEDSISLWKVRKGLNGKVRAWRNLITNRETMAQPRICRGAILADDMGLGKTITTLALIAHTMQEAKAFGAFKVQREAGADLLEAMQSIGSANGASSAKAEENEDVKAKNRSKRRLRDSSDEDDMYLDDDEDEDATPPMSLAVHNAPPASKSKGNGRKPNKDKVDPEILRRQHLERRSRATLIVCPLSVVSNWEEQFKEHWARRKRPSIYIYHGPSRATNIKWIANHDIVLTTYSTLGSEFSNQSTWVTDDLGSDSKKRGGKKGSPSDSPEGNADGEDDDDDIFMVNENSIPIEDEADKKGKKKRRKPAKEALNPLQRIEWFRVVLDEAHIIKGAGTWQSKAACNLSAQRRLCLTGTPIQNSINDLFALVKFLRLDPFTDRATWNEFCGHRERPGLRAKGKDDEPIDTANLGHVQILMKFLALRRQKTTKTADGKQILTLPPKLSKTEYLDFEEAEKARYQALHDRYREEFEEMIASDSVNNNYATILHEILNLRMTCDHPSMVDASKDAKRMGAGADLSEAIKQDGLSRERAAILFILFRDSEMAYCSECQTDLSLSVDRDAAGNDAQELSDALDIAASDSHNGKRPAKRTRIEPGFRSETHSAAMSASMSRNGIDTPAEGAARPVVTRCQHIFCSNCFRRTIGYPWPDVTASDVGSCPTCRTALQLVVDAIELEPTDFIGLNDDQAERVADGDSDFIDNGMETERKWKKSKAEDSEVDELKDDFDWGSGDEKAPRPKAPRKNGKESDVPARGRGDISLEGRKDLSTKIRALISDLLPFSKCNPHSALYDPTAPRLVQIDPSTSEDAQVRQVEDPVVVIQRPPPAVTSSGLLGKLDQSLEALDSYEPVKSVVFSQWTKMLDRIQKSLFITGIRMVRLDGTMKRTDRSAALEAFRTDPSIEVLLVSLRAGGTGLNLVTACRAYLMDPYWNPAVENQGLDRVHRMGQTRPVITTKYVMRHSIEENMLRLQKRKMLLAETVGNKRQIGGAPSSREERREELRILFGASTGGVELDTR
ncbi:related to RAD16 - nucleotide excision repair protein [Ustilago trichophora]|uniref:Related to RAD16 - nucleotide excision repair protein n=1 Tax=Ustilago trichophora TaxID=86804 RepID=A0A5C3DSR9_9BASI|nr:related to RAD16 - nucleotide excision repair protein [Ustilago trichophora]